jgi:hypothetical protein
MKFRIWLAGLFLLIGLSGCGDVPATSTQVPANTPATANTPVTANTPAAAKTPAAEATGQPVGNATRPPAAGSPAFSFMPKQGPGGIILHAAGANFVPTSTVILRLGTPNPVGDPLTSVKVDAAGKWSGTITVPGTLPNGQAIPAGEIRIVALDESNNVLASQAFKFVPQP